MLGMGRLAIPTIAYLWRGSAAARQRRPYDSGLQPTPDLTPAAIEVSGRGQLEPKQGWRRRRPETSIAGFGPDGRPPDLGATTAVARQLASRQGHESPRWPNRPCNRGSSRRFPGRLTPLRKQQVLGSNPSIVSSPAGSFRGSRDQATIWRVPSPKMIMAGSLQPKFDQIGRAHV